MPESKIRIPKDALTEAKTISERKGQDESFVVCVWIAKEVNKDKDGKEIPNSLVFEFEDENQNLCSVIISDSIYKKICLILGKGKCAKVSAKDPLDNFSQRNVVEG